MWPMKGHLVPWITGYNGIMSNAFWNHWWCSDTFLLTCVTNFGMSYGGQLSESVRSCGGKYWYCSCLAALCSEQHVVSNELEIKSGWLFHCHFLSMVNAIFESGPTSSVPKNWRRGGLEYRNNRDMRRRRKNFVIFCPNPDLFGLILQPMGWALAPNPPPGYAGGGLSTGQGSTTQHLSSRKKHLGKGQQHRRNVSDTGSWV